MRLRFINHASVQIEQNGESLLMDPWLSERIFNGAWALVKDVGVDSLDLATLRYIWISHEHPDHLHFPSLKKIAAAKTGPITVFYRKQENPNVRQAIEKLGFNFQELEEGTEHVLANGLKLRTYLTATDAALYVEGAEFNVLNLNDCILSETRLDEIKSLWKKIDVLLMQFSQAGFQGNPEDEYFRIEDSRRHLLEFLQSRVDILLPKILLPIASHSYFCVETNFYLNAARVFPEEVLNFVEDCEVQILGLGEELQIRGRPPAANLAMAKIWREWMTAVPVLPVEALPTESDITQAAKNYVKITRERIPRFFWPPALRIFLSNRRQMLTIDVRSGTVGLSEEGGAPTGSHVEIPENDFVYFAKFPWGADTIAVAGSLRIHSHLRWKSHYYLRHAAYVFLHRGGYTVGALAWALTFVRSFQWGYDNFLFRRGWK